MMPYQQQQQQQQQQPQYQQQQYTTRGRTTERVQSTPVMTRGPPRGSWYDFSRPVTNLIMLLHADAVVIDTGCAAVAARQICPTLLPTVAPSTGTTSAPAATSTADRARPSVAAFHAEIFDCSYFRLQTLCVTPFSSSKTYFQARAHNHYISFSSHYFELLPSLLCHG
jgi:hypothetical protein